MSISDKDAEKLVVALSESGQLQDAIFSNPLIQYVGKAMEIYREYATGEDSPERQAAFVWNMCKHAGADVRIEDVPELIAISQNPLAFFGIGRSH